MNANTSGRRRRDKKFVIIKSDVVNDDHSMTCNMKHITLKMKVK